MKYVREIAIIVVVAVIAAFGYNAFSARSLPLIRVAPNKVAASDTLLFGPMPASKDTLNNSAAHSQVPRVYDPLRERALANPDSMAKLHKKKQGYEVVSLDQVKKLRDAKRALFIDARPKEEFDEGHIPGAQNIPFLDIDNQFATVMKYSCGHACGGLLYRRRLPVGTRLVRLYDEHGVQAYFSVRRRVGWMDQSRHAFGEMNSTSDRLTKR